MSKQKPMLMESPLTDCVYIVTSYVDNGNGMFTARQKYDVTEQFEAIAKHRERSAEPGSERDYSGYTEGDVEGVRDMIDELHADGYIEGFHHQMLHDAIAELGSGTCENVWAEFGKFKCSECAMEVNAISTNTTTPRPIVFCPNCGRKVMER